ncbi:lymphatic vessel endothelial hyaluronic acid receptor 1 [Seriola lalandi dorsalis]|uniref:Lymphatic vessel endothelial hyaluronic receptor 1a n=1 Tax=Seriola lalandi dorsalis TaxID=1841481 RepID=A0A3B4YZ90_SERLL|nr:lymphatic vessel endothelial hyaluronic acid receptor 1 [Seriola lalandi dorsalis]
MNMIWLCITSVLSITSVISGQVFDTSHIRVFPAVNRSIAGIFQVSAINDLNQPQYAFNASEARRLCSFLGVNIASKSQVQDALTRGLETCRFGWIDEHLAIIPRIKALSNCGKSQTGLVTWRASVTQKFDVFCFNESDAATQLKDTTSDRPLSSRDYSVQTNSIQTTHSTSSSSPFPPSSSAPKAIDNEAEPVLYVGSAQGSAGAKIVLITSTCALLLTAIIILAYLKWRSWSQSSDKEQQQEYIKTEDWTCMKAIRETKADVQEDERIEVGDNAN